MLAHIVHSTQRFQIFFNNLTIGFVLSTRIGKNLANEFNFPTNLCTSFKFIGLIIFIIASHFSGFASMPLLVSMKPKNIPPLTPKYFFKIFHMSLHFTRFNDRIININLHILSNLFFKHLVHQTLICCLSIF